MTTPHNHHPGAFTTRELDSWWKDIHAAPLSLLPHHTQRLTKAVQFGLIGAFDAQSFQDAIVARTRAAHVVVPNAT